MFINWKRAALLVAVMPVSLVAQAEFKAVPGEFIVKFKKSFHSGLKKSLLSKGITLDRAITKSDPLLFVVKTERKNTLKKIEALLNSDDSIEYVEPNFIYELVRPVESFSLEDLINPTSDYKEDPYTPKDPQFSKLWGLNNTGSNAPGGESGVVGADIDAIKAWAIESGSKDVKIAIIDTGIDYNHPDLVDQMWVNEAELNGVGGVDDDGNGYVDDIHGYDFANNDGDPLDGHSHGTHCAGTIGASHNDRGVAGIMKDVNLVAVKFLTDGGSGSTDNAIKAIDYAIKIDVDIMSNSWGGGGYSRALEEAIQRASEAGIVFTAAAGNSSENNDASPHYPSNYQVPNVVSVAATTNADELASFSCFGRSTVHIAAPGHKILSTTKNGQYASYSGTSMATPHVTGALGLLIAQNGRMDHLVLKERLLYTSEPLTGLRGKAITSGRLNAFNLVSNTRPLRNEPDPTKWESYSVDRWESEHPYGQNLDIKKKYQIPGAKYIRVVVKKYELELKFDFLTLYNGEGKVSEVISGEGENFKSWYVEGDTIEVAFTSDQSVSKWGFMIEELEVQY